VASEAITPPGYKGSKVHERAHLVAKGLGGPGQLGDGGKFNLVALTPTANSRMGKLEKQLIKMMRTSDRVVVYEVEPIYKGSRKVPIAIKMRAWSDGKLVKIGDKNFSYRIENTP